MAYVLVLIVLAIVLFAISSPFRRAVALVPGSGAGEAGERDPVTIDGPDPVAELEAARDAKYREIRDAELDVRTGKLSQEDYDAIDGTLRAEAIEILHALDEARDRLASAP